MPLLFSLEECLKKSGRTGIMVSKGLEREGKMLLELFLTFAKIGLFTFGGGYAMLALIENVCVEKKGWITHEEMMEVTVIAESTPGPIAINCATYVGCRQAGLKGATAATLGVVLPSFVIIFAISQFLANFLEYTLIANAFRGIKIAVGILIVNAAMNMLKKMKKTPLSRGIVICGYGAMLAIDLLALNISAIVVMLAAGAVSVGLFARKQKGGKV